MDVWVERHRGDDVLVVYDSIKDRATDSSHCDVATRIAQRAHMADRLVGCNRADAVILFTHPPRRPWCSRSCWRFRRGAFAADQSLAAKLANECSIRG